MSRPRQWGRYRVNVNCVAFGHVETRLTQDFDGKPPKIRVGDREVPTGIAGPARSLLQMVTPLGRPGTVEEAAGAVYLFCIPESDYVTGEVLVASGGLRI
jgi:3-oxoacyl-[acyl-carrier protein] reductase